MTVVATLPTNPTIPSRDVKANIPIRSVLEEMLIFGSIHTCQVAGQDLAPLEGGGRFSELQIGYIFLSIISIINNKNIDKA